MISLIGKAFFSKVFAGVGVLALNFLLGYYYGVSGVGQFMFMLSIMVGLSVLIRLGMDNALIRDLSISYMEGRYGELLESALCSLAWCFFFSLLIVFLYLIFSTFVFNIGTDITTPIMIALPFYSSIYLQSSMLKAVNHAAISPFFETGSVAVFLSLLIVFLQYIKADSFVLVGWGFLIGSILTFVLGSAVLIRKIFILNKQPRAVTPKNIFVYPWRKFKGLGSFFVLSGNAYLAQWGIVFLLGYILSDSDVGAFTLAHRVTLLISFILIVVNGVVSPKFSHLYSRGDKESLQSLVHSIFWIGFFMAIVAYGFIVILGENLINKFIPDAQQIGILLIILGGAQVINVLTGPGTYLLMMTRNEQYLRNYMLIFSFFNFITLVPVAMFYGVVWAAIVFGFSEALKNIGLMLSVNRRLGIKILPIWRA